MHVFSLGRDILSAEFVEMDVAKYLLKLWFSSGVIWPPFPGDIFGCHNQGGRVGVLLALSRWRPGILQIPHNTEDTPSLKSMIQPRMSVVPRVRNAGLDKILKQCEIYVNIFFKVMCNLTSLQVGDSSHDAVNTCH